MFQPLFKGKSYEEDREIAEGCHRHIKKIFTELDEFRAFELLRNGMYGICSNFILSFRSALRAESLQI